MNSMEVYDDKAIKRTHGQLLATGVGAPLAASLLEAYITLKMMEGAFQVTITSVVQDGLFIIEDQSGILHESLSALYRNPKAAQALDGLLRKNRVSVHRYEHYAVTLYRTCFEAEFLDSPDCFKIPIRRELVRRALPTSEFLRKVQRKAACGLHGFNSARAVAQGIRHG